MIIGSGRKAPYQKAYSVSVMVDGVVRVLSWEGYCNNITEALYQALAKEDRRIQGSKQARVREESEG